MFIPRRCVALACLLLPFVANANEPASPDAVISLSPEHLTALPTNPWACDVLIPAAGDTRGARHGACIARSS
jgi:hypothetical protein